MAPVGGGSKSMIPPNGSGLVFRLRATDSIQRPGRSAQGTQRPAFMERPASDIRAPAVTSRPITRLNISCTSSALDPCGSSIFEPRRTWMRLASTTASARGGRTRCWGLVTVWSSVAEGGGPILTGSFIDRGRRRRHRPTSPFSGRVRFESRAGGWTPAPSNWTTWCFVMSSPSASATECRPNSRRRLRVSVVTPIFALLIVPVSDEDHPTLGCERGSRERQR